MNYLNTIVVFSVMYLTLWRMMNAKVWAERRKRWEIDKGSAEKSDRIRELSAILEQRTIIKEVEVEKIVKVVERVEVPTPAKPRGKKCPYCEFGRSMTFCETCGKRHPESDIPIRRVPWEDVNQWMHAHAHWDEEREYKNVNEIVLPWASSDKDERFTVDGIEYVYSKEDPSTINSSTGNENFVTVLEFNHPILGNIKLINLCDDDNGHAMEDDSDDTELSEGNITDLKIPFRQAVKRALLALYLYRTAEPTGEVVAIMAESERPHAE